MLLKTQIFEKETANFPVKKRFWLTFSRIFECDKPHVTNCKGTKSIAIITVEAMRAFL